MKRKKGRKEGWIKAREGGKKEGGKVTESKGRENK